MFSVPDHLDSTHHQGRIRDLIGGAPDRDRPKTAILGPQFCRILVLGPHFWWSGGAPPDPPLHHRGHNSTRSSTCATCNRLQIFNKLEVSRLDSTLSVFVIIRTIQTLSGTTLTEIILIAMHQFQSSIKRTILATLNF